MKRRLWKFPGGIKLSGNKSLSSSGAIQPLPVPPRLYVPVRQHIGEPATVLVNSGETVYKGQLIAENNGYISSPIHAPSSGTVIEITKYPLPHASRIKETTIVIETDGLDQWHPSVQPVPKPLNLSSEELRSRVRDAGVVGLGGAVFPSAVKLKPTREIETLIINGVECEPYITCDDAIMTQRSESLLRGILLLARIIKPVEIILAIEDNKPVAQQCINEALKKLKSAGVLAASTIQPVMVPTKFPAGGEKQLIKVLTGKEVSSKSLPFEVGVVCLNVGTAVAIHDAIYKGQPLISRTMTVTGEQVKQPGNYQVLLGTPINFVLEVAQASGLDFSDVIMGGPMMGVALADNSAPVVKASNCLLVKSIQPAKQLTHTLPCIRCGQCASVCPMKLIPQQLYWHARGKSFSKLESYHVDDCIECGCCQVVCPSQIPLVHYFRYAKSEIKAQEQERKLADVARLRNELREQRLERKKREAEERKAKRKAARKKRKPKAEAPGVNDEENPVPAEGAAVVTEQQEVEKQKLNSASVR
ncbi:MAG: electron transport complex subunit RsxC [Gammaproteobacteria bacterium]